MFGWRARVQAANQDVSVQSLDEWHSSQVPNQASASPLIAIIWGALVAEGEVAGGLPTRVVIELLLFGGTTGLQPQTGSQPGLQR
jgi:hypothetical protein